MLHRNANKFSGSFPSKNPKQDGEGQDKWKAKWVICRLCKKNWRMRCKCLENLVIPAHRKNGCQRQCLRQINDFDKLLFAKAFFRISPNFLLGPGWGRSSENLYSFLVGNWADRISSYFLASWRRGFSLLGGQVARHSCLWIWGENWGQQIC